MKHEKPTLHHGVYNCLCRKWGRDPDKRDLRPLHSIAVNGALFVELKPRKAKK